MTRESRYKHHCLTEGSFNHITALCRDNGKDSMLCHLTGGGGGGVESSHHTAQERWCVGNIEVSTDG